MIQNPKYVIKQSYNTQYHWTLKAKNGETILSSQMYGTKQSAAVGIHSSKNNISDRNFERKLSSNGQYYFTQIATNGEVIGTSEMYNSSSARDAGILSVKVNAPIAGIEDLTIKVY